MVEFPIEEIIKIQKFMNPKISFDGNKLSYIMNDDDNVNLIVRDLNNSIEKIILTSYKSLKSYFWINNNSIALSHDTDGDECFKLIFINLETLKKTAIECFNSRNIHILNNGNILDDKLYVAIEYKDNKFQDVYCIDIITKKVELIKKNPGNISDWFIDAKGRTIAGYISREDGGIDLVLVDKDNSYITLINWDVDDIFTSDFITFSNDVRHLYVKDSSMSVTSSLVRIDLISRNQEVLYNDKAFDIEDAVINPLSGEIDALNVYRDKRNWIILNKDLDKDITFLNSLGLGDMQIVSRDKQDVFWILKFEQDVSGPSYYLFNRENKIIQLLFYERPQLQNYKFSPMEPIRFISRDGLNITGYLTMPKEKTSKVPLVVNVHGGPQSRDYRRFNPFVQWIVSQGFGCLQINYRGSVGFGKNFIRKGYKEWGGKMQDDIVDGVNWTIKNYNIDPTRICRIC